MVRFFGGGGVGISAAVGFLGGGVGFLGGGMVLGVCSRCFAGSWLGGVVFAWDAGGFLLIVGAVGVCEELLMMALKDDESTSDENDKEKLEIAELRPLTPVASLC